MDAANMKKGVSEKRTGLSDKQIAGTLFLVTFVIVAVMGCLLNLAYILDETGVVANAAYLAGYNWHDWVRATGGYYYKYGSALLYIPIMKIFNNPYVIYKMIMIVNSILVAMVPVCAYRILREHLLLDDRKLCATLSFVVGIVPASVLYSINAKADVALITWTWVLLVTILECMSAKEKRKQYILSVLIAFFSVYLYMCHTRGVVFVIAAFMTVFAIRFILKNKSVKFLAYVAGVIVFMAIDKKLTSFFKHRIWGTGKLKNTMDGFNWGKYRKMFTFTGAKTLIKNGSGWFVDSIIGTYGFVIVGLFFAICIIVLYLKKKDVSQKEFVISLYGALVFVGTMALGMLFFFNVIFKVAAGKSASRIDRLFYSRYMSPTYAILILVALYYLFIKKDLFGWKSKLVAVIFSGAMIVTVRMWIYSLPENFGFSWRNVLDCGLTYSPDHYGNDAGSFEKTVIADALMKGAIISFVIFVIFILLSLKKIQKQRVVICLAGLCFMVNLISNYIKLRYNADMRTMNACGSVFTEMEGIVDRYESVVEEFHDLYFDSTSGYGYKFYQMGLPNFNVLVKKKAKFEEMDDAFIVVRTHVINELWMGDDCYLLKDYDYNKNVNAIIVKGEKLKKALEEHGIQVVEIPEDYALHERNSVPDDYWEAVEASWQYQRESFSN